MVDIDEHLLCAICREVLVKPRMTPCGHLFCSECLDKYITFTTDPKLEEEPETDSDTSLTEPSEALETFYDIIENNPENVISHNNTHDDYTSDECDEEVVNENGTNIENFNDPASENADRVTIIVSDDSDVEEIDENDSSLDLEIDSNDENEESDEDEENSEDGDDFVKSNDYRIIRCPIDRKSMKVSDVSKPPLAILNILEDLTIKCPNALSGCDKVIQYSAIEEHLKVCFYGIVQCVCGTTCLRKYINTEIDENDDSIHKVRIKRQLDGKVCPQLVCKYHMQISCDFCHKKLLKQDKNVHISTVCKGNQKCTGCKAIINVKDYKDHTNNCSFFESKCVGYKYGCSFIGKNILRQTHEKECNIAKMSAWCKKLESKLEDSEKENKRIKERLALLKRNASEFTSANIEQNKSDIDYLLSEFAKFRRNIENISQTCRVNDTKKTSQIKEESSKIYEKIDQIKFNIATLRHQVQYVKTLKRNFMQAPTLFSSDNLRNVNIFNNDVFDFHERLNALPSLNVNDDGNRRTGVHERVSGMLSRNGSVGEEHVSLAMICDSSVPKELAYILKRTI